VQEGGIDPDIIVPQLSDPDYKDRPRLREADLRRHLINEAKVDDKVLEDDGKPDPRFADRRAAEEGRDRRLPAELCGRRRSRVWRARRRRRHWRRPAWVRWRAGEVGRGRTAATAVPMKGLALARWLALLVPAALLAVRSARNMWAGSTPARCATGSAGRITPRWRSR
jgi:hypothetical protein